MIDTALGEAPLARDEVKRLMTIRGVDATVGCRSWPRSATSTPSSARAARLVSGAQSAGAPVPRADRLAWADHRARSRRTPAGCWSRPPG
jgi:hypothetical protein